jgi:hypothetical protein
MQVEECYAVMRFWGYVEIRRGVSILWRGRDRTGSPIQTPIFEAEPPEARRTYLDRVAEIGCHEWPASAAYAQANSA